ncbi:hypothetical protein FC96_GL000935 [Secundilactobacillus kimchicus JCM 15530]|uniref:Uncharacterized protein n=1 Tax=Secundilactobacillus kimchicus JCM 15530 TaxID=1302272 RepID=A0A0R1HVM3_9LACO|nr:hypothetical protein FC96_GL000935 [Secundilactobacillus kimchicus JCM 15530]
MVSKKVKPLCIADVAPFDVNLIASSTSFWASLIVFCPVCEIPPLMLCQESLATCLTASPIAFLIKYGVSPIDLISLDHPVATLAIPSPIPLAAVETLFPIPVAPVVTPPATPFAPLTTAPATPLAASIIGFVTSFKISCMGPEIALTIASINFPGSIMFPKLPIISPTASAFATVVDACATLAACDVIPDVPKVKSKLENNNIDFFDFLKTLSPSKIC